MKFFRAESQRDTELNDYMFGYAVNSRKFIEGLRKNIALKMIGENYLSSLQANYSFPVPKGTKNILTDQKVTDAYLPPVSTETRARFENKVFAKFAGEEKFRHIYYYNLYFRVKK